MKNVILVDDSILFLEVMEDYINQYRKDIKCVKFYTPRKVLSYLAEGNEVDILITDYQLPGITGIELANYVLQRHCHTRVVICSNFNDEYIKRRGLEYGLIGVTGIEDKIELYSKTRIVELVNSL